MFIALNIVFVRFLSFMTPDKAVRISFQFLPDAICGMVLGPVWAMASCISADLLGMMINSGGGMYYPGFTLSAAVQGLLFGLILYKGKRDLKFCFAGVLAVSLVVDAGLNSVWVHHMYGIEWGAVLATRLPPIAIMLPVRVFLIYLTSKLLYKTKISILR